LLVRYSKTSGAKIYAAHVNHGIRGEEALRDQMFCIDFCKTCGIPLEVININAPAYAEQNGIGLEEAARILRYSCFEKISKKHGINKIATAHTASDNLETVIFNLTRGCSAEGIKGIPPVRDNIIRPLIYCSTQEILDVCSSEKLSFVTDSTNLDTEYTRNNIRHNIIPMLKNINPSVEKCVTNLSESIRNDTAFLNSTAKELYTNETNKLSTLPSPILSRILISMYNEVCPSGVQLSYRHVSDMISLLADYSENNLSENKSLSLPGKIVFSVNKNTVSFDKEKKPVRKLNSRYLIRGLQEFTETGEAVILAFSEKEAVEIIKKNIYNIYTYTVVNKSIITDKIVVRCREDGDVFKYSNITKKVKKMMNENQIDIEARNAMPLFCDSKGIFWIPGIALRDDAQLAPQDEPAYIYYLKRE